MFTYCDYGTIPYFSKLFFQAKFSKFSKVDFGKVWKVWKTWKNFGAYLRRNTFARGRYIRRYPSFIFTRAIADLTIMMTSLKNSGPVCRPDCLLQPSAGQGAACAGGWKHNAARKMLSARRGESIADNAHSVEDHQSSAPEFQWQWAPTVTMQSESVQERNALSLGSACPQVCLVPVLLPKMWIWRYILAWFSSFFV